MPTIITHPKEPKARRNRNAKFRRSAGHPGGLAVRIGGIRLYRLGLWHF
jgi:hypothetical protein